MTQYREVDLRGVRTMSIADRPSKVRREHLAPPPDPGRPVGRLLELLPDQLAARGLRRLVAAIAAAHAAGRPVVAMLGGHVVKTGCGPCLAALCREQILTCLVMNGAAAIHDFELAVWGKTSETVEESLGAGTFGMVEETSRLMNEATLEGQRRGQGLGESLAEKLEAIDAPYRDTSLLGTAHATGLPVTVHVALGTDILHQHPTADGAAIGDTSLRDFRRLAGALRGLSGGVVLNLGSAVILPEVFLKALSVLRNLGESLEALVTANLDFQRHYRPTQNVLHRPTQGIGEGIELIGHHEIMLPVLCALVLDAVRRQGAGPGA
ncbi:MAG: hypothetical protein PVF43_07695 [Candidatus Eiseniibacteriota bacterium]|jgi:hypothetical protein